MGPLLSLVAVLVCHVAQVDPVSININRLVDQAIDNSRSQIVDMGFDPFPILPFSSAFQVSLFVTTADVRVETLEGYFEGLSTLTRTGDLSIDWTNNVMTLVMSLGLQRADLNLTTTLIYWNEWLAFNGTLVGSAQKVQLGANFSVVYERASCHGVLNEVQVEELSGVYMSIVGLGWLDWPVSSAISAVLYVFNWRIRTMLSESIKENAEKALDGLDLCGLIS